VKNRPKLLFTFNLLLLFLLASCGNNASKMMKMEEGLKADENYSFKYMRVVKVSGWKEKDGSVASEITLLPYGEWDYTWTFICKCDLTNYDVNDHINIDSTKNLITSYGSPWPGMGVIIFLLTQVLSVPVAYGIARVLYVVIWLMLFLLIYGGYIQSKNADENNESINGENSIRRESKDDGKSA